MSVHVAATEAAATQVTATDASAAAPGFDPEVGSDHAVGSAQRDTPAARIALLGTGAVGSAWLARLHRLDGKPGLPALSLVRIANSRGACTRSDGFDLSSLSRDPAVALAQPWTEDARPATEHGATDPCVAALGVRGTRIIVDATASDAVAEQHARWLAQGIHVVTACKLGQGTSLARWQAIQRAQHEAGTCYGDAATVGAGLPLLRTVRALQSGGDRVHALAAVLSGSLAWLFAAFDGRQPFSSLLLQARDRGYTEPDPREDLSGADVARKLAIVLRGAGIRIEADAIRVEPLLAAAHASATQSSATQRPGCNGFDALDRAMQARLEAARRAGHCLRHVARFDARGARVGLESLPPDDPLAPAGGCDNRMALWTDRYRDSPLLIQGPGAGADVTAAALMDDVLAIAAARDAGGGARIG